MSSGSVALSNPSDQPKESGKQAVEKNNVSDGLEYVPPPQSAVTTT